MKRLKILLVVLLSFLLTGCIQEFDETEVQTDAIAEYMAGMLLKSDKEYGEALVPIESTTEDSTAEDSTAEEHNTGNSESDNNVNHTDASNNTDSSSDNKDQIDSSKEEADNTLTQVVGEPGFEIKYNDIELVETYPEDPINEGFYLEYNKGYQYLVASFTVKNITDKKKSINLIKSGIEYQLNVGSKEYVPSLTLLENDLRYLDLSIAAGKSKEVLLIFKIPNDIEENEINLTTTKDKKTVTILLR